MDFSPDGSLLAAVISNNRAAIWQVLDGRLLFTIEPESGYIQTLSFSPDGKTLGMVESNSNRADSGDFFARFYAIK